MIALKRFLLVSIIANALLWETKAQDAYEHVAENVVISQQADKKSGITKRTILIGNKVCGKRGFVDKNNKAEEKGGARKRQNIDFDALHRDLHPERVKDEVAKAPNVIKDNKHAPPIVVSKVGSGPGWFARLNRCCIDHENCDKSIPAKSDRFGFKNDKEYTIYDCKCDDSFSECLRYADSHTADAVGDLYFNVLKMPCINFENGTNATATDDMLLGKVDRMVEERMKEKEQKLVTDEEKENEPTGEEAEKEKMESVKGNENDNGGEKLSVRDKNNDPTERKARHFKANSH